MQLPPLLNFLFARPFKPFTVLLADRRSVVVSHPETAIVYHGGLGLWVSLPTGQLEFIDGNAVVSFLSAGPVNPSDFIQQL